MILDYVQLKQIKRAYDTAERWIIAVNIRSLLKQRKIKVYELADILDTSKANAYEYTKERGQKLKPGLYNLLILAAYLDIDPMQLFTITGTSQYNNDNE